MRIPPLWPCVIRCNLRMVTIGDPFIPAAQLAIFLDSWRRRGTGVQFPANRLSRETFVWQKKIVEWRNSNKNDLHGSKGGVEGAIRWNLGRVIGNRWAFYPSSSVGNSLTLGSVDYNNRFLSYALALLTCFSTQKHGHFVVLFGPVMTGAYEIPYAIFPTLSTNSLTPTRLRQLPITA